MRTPMIAGNWKMNKTPSETKALIEDLKKLENRSGAEVVVCPMTVSLTAAAEALNNNDEAWHREFNIDNYKRRRQWAEKIMDVLGCTYDKNQVGMFLWGKIPADVQNVEDLTERVLHEARVFITPGFIFGSNGERYIRISLCAKEEKLEAALRRIEKLKN